MWIAGDVRAEGGGGGCGASAAVSGWETVCEADSGGRGAERINIKEMGGSTDERRKMDVISMGSEEPAKIQMHCK
ncbi:UNVERIFIED_CONTAM: hypothetical protein DV099_10360, partial [Bifidobacterium longum]|nr:hypothetical protein [Bifidobacterium longum]